MRSVGCIACMQEGNFSYPSRQHENTKYNFWTARPITAKFWMKDVINTDETPQKQQQTFCYLKLIYIYIRPQNSCLIWIILQQHSTQGHMTIRTTDFVQRICYAQHMASNYFQCDLKCQLYSAHMQQTGCWGEYLDLWGRREHRQNCRTRSLVIWTRHQILHEWSRLDVWSRHVGSSSGKLM